MNKLQVVFQSIIFIAGTLVFTACSQGQKTEQSEAADDTEMMEVDDHNEEGMTHEHEEGHAMSTETEANKTWTPSGNGTDLIKSDFHFVAGSIENVKPEVKNVDGIAVLELTADATPTAFVFHKSYGNVGMIASLDASKFKGTVRLIHHAQNTENYEFVAINGNHMKLGRIVNGKETIFNESDFDSASGWLNLRVSAAGTHFKGYINDKTITHGHGDKMKDGFAGVMLEGTGTLLLKSIELAELEDE